MCRSQAPVRTADSLPIVTRVGARGTEGQVSHFPSPTAPPTPKRKTRSKESGLLFPLANGTTHTQTQNVRGLPLQNADSGVMADLYSYDGNESRVRSPISPRQRHHPHPNAKRSRPAAAKRRQRRDVRPVQLRRQRQHHGHRRPAASHQQPRYGLRRARPPDRCQRAQRVSS
jgi:hypothetical protein